MDMLKKAVVGFILILATFVGTYTFRHMQDEFSIMSTYKTTMDNYESTALHVIMNTQKYDAGEMLIRIKDYYCSLNGSPNELHITLYDSRKDFEEGNYIAKGDFALN